MSTDNLLQATVRNTFLHVEDPNQEEAGVLNRSQSWPSISSSTQSNSDVELPYNLKAVPSQLGPIARPDPVGPVIEQVSGDSSGSSGFYDHVANQQKQENQEKNKLWKAEMSQNIMSNGLVDGPAWSKGSELHHLCQCRPCGWYWRRGCKAGAACSFCHLCGELELKSRRRDKTETLREEHREGKRVEAERAADEQEDEGAAAAASPKRHARYKNASSSNSGGYNAVSADAQAAGKRQKPAKKVGLQPKKLPDASGNKKDGYGPPAKAEDGSRFSL